jgi:2-oxoglutarate ferredoxin oxidoreductase subunit alpha
MCKPFEYPGTPMDRGKVLWEADLEGLQGNWGRYLDKDGDGITYRTFPGNKHPMSAYFLRGTGHDENARYSEDPGMWMRNMERLKKKYDTARQYVPAPVLRTMKGASIGIIAYGSSEAAVEEARFQLNRDHSIKADFLRVRALPFTEQVREFVEKHERTFVIDMNRDGQLHQLLTLEHPEYATRLLSVAYGDGMPASARWVREGILAKMEKPASKRKASTGTARPKAAGANVTAESNGKKPVRAVSMKKNVPATAARKSAPRLKSSAKK